MLKIIGSVYSDTGQVRQQNEDNLYWQGQYRKSYELAGTLKRNFKDDHDVQLYAVSDGMGGMARGELASRIAVSELASLDRSLKQGHPDDDTAKIDHYLQNCSRYISERNSSAGSEKEAMGATLSLLMLRDDRAVLANLGDTAVYHSRDGLMKQISRDDSHAARLRSLGYLTSEEARRHPFKHSLVNYLGKEEADGVLKYFLVPDIRLSTGDFLLLCSDGISGVLSREIIQEVLNDAQPPEQKVESLVNLAVASGSADNMTIILLYVAEASSPRSRAEAAYYASAPVEGEDLLRYEAADAAAQAGTAAAAAGAAAKAAEAVQPVPAAAPKSELRKPQRRSVDDETKRMIPPERTTVYRPLTPEAAPPPSPAANSPAGADDFYEPLVSEPLPVKPVRVFADASDEIKPWPEKKQNDKNAELSPEQLAYYNKAREEAKRRQAQRRYSGNMQEEMRSPDNQPVSGHYSKTENVPEAHRQYAPPGRYPQGGAPEEQPVPAVPPMSREEKQRIYDMRYQDPETLQPPVEGTPPSGSRSHYKSRPAAGEGRGRSAFVSFLSWIIWILVFVLIGFGITWLLMYVVPEFMK